MAQNSPGADSRYIRTLFATGTAAGMSDAQLLERFTEAAGAAAVAEAAFAALLARHGPMVLGVCRRALADPRDVEDAFQATFLILVRKAGTVRVDDSLGRWLYGVARRVASRARARVVAERRRAREGLNATGEPTTPAPDAARAELLMALDEELGRLPEKFRTPMVLCYLEGLSHAEAASRLRWPVGTVKGRLAQARSLLQARLTRRGLAPSAAILGTTLATETRAALPASLAETTVQAALRLALGGTAAATLISAPALDLTKGVLTAMLMTKLKTIAVVLSVAGVIAAGGVGLAQADRGGRDDQEKGQEVRRAEGPPARSGTGVRGRADASPKSEQSDGTKAAPANDRGEPVICNVYLAPVVISLKPDGSRVEKGDLICELDPSAIQGELVKQKPKTLEAEAAYQNARLAREVAAIAVTEYIEGTFKQELETVLGEIVAAQTAVQKAEDRLERTRRARDQMKVVLSRKGGANTPADIMAQLDIEDRLDTVEQTLHREKRSLEQASTKKNVLEQYTKAKTIKELEREVEKARADELVKRAVHEREQSFVKQLESQIESCRVLAPVGGLIRYRRPLAAGSRLTRGQILCDVVPAEAPKAEAK